MSAFLRLVFYFIRHIERSENMQEKEFASPYFQAIIKSTEIVFGGINFSEISFGKISFGESHFVVLA